jgi:alkylation response protein AidB-like acyl-CoA dehydrogenase
MSKDYTEEEQMIVDLVREFCENEIKSIESEIDLKAQIPEELLKKLGEIGLYGMLVSEKYGGVDGSISALMSGIRELAKYSAAVSSLVLFHNALTCRIIEKYGNEEQKNTLLKELAIGKRIGTVVFGDNGSFLNLDDVKTDAEFNGEEYTISGRKNVVLNGKYADLFIILARIKEQFGFFIVDANNKGLSKGKPIELTGLKGNEVSSISFYSCKVSKDQIIGDVDKTDEIIKDLSDNVLLGLTSINVGISESALKEATKYANERKQFGKQIGTFEAVQAMLANIFIEEKFVKNLLETTSNEKDKGEDISVDSVICKIASSRMVENNTKSALKIHGGYGYIKDYPVERYVRDAATVKILCDNDDDLKVSLARKILGYD